MKNMTKKNALKCKQFAYVPKIVKWSKLSTLFTGFCLASNKKCLKDEHTQKIQNTIKKKISFLVVPFSKQKKSVVKMYHNLT